VSEIASHWLFVLGAMPACSVSAGTFCVSVWRLTVLPCSRCLTVLCRPQPISSKHDGFLQVLLQSLLVLQRV
jgi:hypothetical protein